MTIVINPGEQVMGLIEEVAPGLDGLAQLQALIASGRKPGILKSLVFER